MQFVCVYVCVITIARLELKVKVIEGQGIKGQCPARMGVVTK